MAQEPSPGLRRGPIKIGEHIVEQRVLTVEEIDRFAALCGDMNPLHHDEDYARQTRFGGVVACGPQVTSLMMGMAATYFSHEGAMLGLEFTFCFRKAVKAGERITMDWEILSSVYKASLHGEIVCLQGTATQQGEVVLEGQGKILALDEL